MSWITLAKVKLFSQYGHTYTPHRQKHLWECKRSVPLHSWGSKNKVSLWVCVLQGGRTSCFLKDTDDSNKHCSRFQTSAGISGWIKHAQTFLFCFYSMHIKTKINTTGEWLGERPGLNLNLNFRIFTWIQKLMLCAMSLNDKLKGKKTHALLWKGFLVRFCNKFEDIIVLKKEKWIQVNTKLFWAISLIL